MAERESVKIVSAGLAEAEGGDIVLRGLLDPSSMKLLHVDEYQREILSAKKIEKLRKALRKGKVPDVVLGMRGEGYREREAAFYLTDEVYIIDGLQRITAALHEMLADSEFRPRLGATVHFSTTEDIEREMFEDLNLGQTKLSSNVTLRNQRSKNTAADALYRLSNDRGFIMKDRICWMQTMRRTDLITATTFFKVAGMLHSHAGPGRGSNVIELAKGLQKIMDNVGKVTFVNNVRAFFEPIDQAWGVNRVSFRHGASYLKTSFMIELARVFSNHENFWEGDKLVVPKDVIKKLSLFPISDPEVMRLSSSGGSAGELLYMLMVKHVNAGKRSRHLRLRSGLLDRSLEESDNDYDEPEEA